MKTNQSFCINTRIGLSPEELDNLFSRPVMFGIAQVILEEPELAEEAAEACEAVLDSLDGYSAAAAIIGCLDALGVLIANAQREIEREQEKEARRQMLTVVK